MKANKVKINPTKRTFGVTTRKFLGFMLTEKGIEVSLVKCKTILEMKSPMTSKEVQRLNGCIVTLLRSMSLLAEKCPTFYKILKKDKSFIWWDDCEKAFD